LSQCRQAGKGVDKSQSCDSSVSHSVLLVAGTYNYCQKWHNQYEPARKTFNPDKLG